MYGTDWLALLLLLAIVMLLFLLFNAVMRKWLQVEKKKLFSYNHINEKHKKMDWTIRVVFLVVLLLGNFINVTREPMEWKYAVNKKDYIFTISQLIFGVLLILTVIQKNFWGLI